MVPSSLVSSHRTAQGGSPASFVRSTLPSVCGEKLPFKVIEFSKATKRITLSHTRLFEEAKRAERAEQAAEKKASAEATKSSMKKINASVEKTTLGDIAGLAELKDAMEAAAKEEK